MALSIRARLTLWYSTAVLVILASGAVAGSLAQSRLAVQRLDDDLGRTMATLEGVMRTEFGEGLSLEASAEEASLEVVAPDRTLVLTRREGGILQVWGVPFDREALSAPLQNAGTTTLATSAGQFRIRTRLVDYGSHRYNAGVLASLDTLHTQHLEMVRAMMLGGAIALIAAAAGGWLIGRQTLKPLTAMADQASLIDEHDPRERLTPPPARDELGQLAVSFNALLDRLASTLNQQRQFMADASHELRTPVSVIRTAAQVTLARDRRTSEEYRESLEIVGEQAGRLSRIVDAMFLLARAEAHGVPLRREFVNLDDLLAESVRGLRVLANQKPVSVSTGGDQEVGLIGDDALLRQMIGNLLDNAIRHAAANGNVSASLGRGGDRVTLRITNDGEPIAPEDRERIFGRFVRLGVSSGAGLGLPIARWIAEAHGGTLQLHESQPGRTTFAVNLPAEPVAVAPASHR